MEEHKDTGYRRAHPGDASKLAALRERQLINEGMTQNNIFVELNQYFIECLSDDSLLCWVFEDAGELVATGALCQTRLPPTFTNPTGRVAYLTNMYTRDAYRRQGIASHIVGLLLNEARARGYVLARLHASEMGKSVYLRHGFTDSTGYMSLRL